MTVNKRDIETIVQPMQPRLKIEVSQEAALDGNIILRGTYSWELTVPKKAEFSSTGLQYHLWLYIATAISHLQDRIKRHHAEVLEMCKKVEEVE